MLAGRCIFYFAIIILIAPGIVENKIFCQTVHRKSGVCVPIWACKTIAELLQNSSILLTVSVVRGVLQAYCGTFNNIEYVCCDPNFVTIGEAAAQVVSKPLYTENIPKLAAFDLASGFEISRRVRQPNANVQSGIIIIFFYFILFYFIFIHQSTVALIE